MDILEAACTNTPDAATAGENRDFHPDSGPDPSFAPCSALPPPYDAAATATAMQTAAAAPTVTG
eukprot:CAMPEP_0182881292 /NCGR_PEP_ID=MMETSP0034_2-20130328/17093_1 /TAXON_ID=156128 /ORGANISM="Nephroselmis pyriformis, Strain CCMP717" /LENGTH=63 /DNA_ID=CAMNT_0025014317 /DNA_START=109 /DNA_END=298 /DNA_ORIENTATION=-